MNKKALIAAMAGAAALLLLKSDAAAALTGEPMDEGENLLTQALDSIADALPADEASQYQAQNEAGYNLDNQNVAAFLQTIRVSEGTAGQNGYRTLVGGALFDSYADHPRQLVWLPNLGIYSSAAGAYQILRRTWDGVAKKLGLPDFAPQSQDLAAVELIRQRGALDDVKAGRFETAVYKCRKEWASLPGAGYGQHENTLQRLQLAYVNAGGSIA